MFNAFWNWIKYVFTSSRVGVIFKTLFKNEKSAIANIILDPENQAAAFKFVCELAKDDSKTSEQKREAFNSEFGAWAKSVGKKLGTVAINTLRELACSALKADNGQ